MAWPLASPEQQPTSGIILFFFRTFQSQHPNGQLDSQSAFWQGKHFNLSELTPLATHRLLFSWSFGHMTTMTNIPWFTLLLSMPVCLFQFDDFEHCIFNAWIKCIFLYIPSWSCFLNRANILTSLCIHKNTSWQVPIALYLRLVVFNDD